MDAEVKRAPRIKKISVSIGPVRALALKHVPALMILQRHIDCDWNQIEAASEQVVAGFYYPEEVDQIEKEEIPESQNPEFDRSASFRPTGTESRRRGIEEDERWEISGSSDGCDLPSL